MIMTLMAPLVEPTIYIEVIQIIWRDSRINFQEITSYTTTADLTSGTPIAVLLLIKLLRRRVDCCLCKCFCSGGLIMVQILVHILSTIHHEIGHAIGLVIKEIITEALVIALMQSILTILGRHQ